MAFFHSPLSASAGRLYEARMSLVEAAEFSHDLPSPSIKAVRGSTIDRGSGLVTHTPTHPHTHTHTHTHTHNTAAAGRSRT
jgi:hypothetical protein